MKESPTFQFYAADFYMDTNEWSCEEVGAYIRLLMSEWINKDLPNDDKKLARIAGLDQKRFQKVSPQLMLKFQKNGNERLINIRLEDTRLNQVKYREKQAIRASHGWATRNAVADAVADAVVMPQGMPDDCSSSSSSNKEYILSSIKEIVVYLNSISGKNFSYKTKGTIAHINARMAEGRTINDFKKVIDIKCKKWLTDPKMCDFIRPDTLFSTKFESYLNEGSGIKPW